MAKLYLGYETARWYWSSALRGAHTLRTHATCRKIDDGMRSASEARRLLESTKFGQLQNVDVILPHDARSSVHATSPGVRFHFCRDAFPPRSFVKLTDNIAIASPELTFVQMAQGESFVQSLLHAYQLCGTFTLDEAAFAGVSEREPLTSKRKLMSFVNQAVGMRGVEKARTVLRYALDGSASPRESKLAIALTLPLARGGKGLPAGNLNQRIEIPDRYRWEGGRSYYVADMLWPERRVVVEYDSDVVHANRWGILRDSDKRNTLHDMGYTAIGLTSFQLDDPVAFDHAAETLRRALKERRRPVPSNYEGRVDALRRELGLSEVSFMPR